MRIQPTFTMLVVAAALAGASQVSAQEPVEEAGGTLLSAAIGSTAGLVGGAYANLAMVVLKARVGKYQHSFSEAFGWESIPIAAGAGVGFSIGLWDEDRLWPWILGGTAGLAAGAGVGYLVGATVWGDPESRWADAAIGAALGMAVGSVIGVFLVGSDDDDGPAASPAAAVRVPLVRLSF